MGLDGSHQQLKHSACQQFTPMSFAQQDSMGEIGEQLALLDRHSQIIQTILDKLVSGGMARGRETASKWAKACMVVVRRSQVGIA